MADLTVQELSMIGIDPAYVAASAGGDKFVNDGKTIIIIKNGGAGTIVATVDSILPCDQGDDHNKVISVLASGEKMAGSYSKARFNDTVGKVAIIYDDVTSVTIGIFKLP